MKKIEANIRITPLKDARKHIPKVETALGQPGSSFKERCRPSQSVSEEILSFLTNFFFRVGNVVSTHPLTTIFTTFAVVALTSLGCFWLYREKISWNLWLPPDADLYQNKIWMDRVFPQNSSSESPVSNGFLQSVIISGENVLSAEGIKKMARLHNRIVNHLPDYDRHCIRMEELKACSNFSILRLWDFDEEAIMRLTEEDVRDALMELTLRVDKRYYLMTLRDVFETPDNSSIAGARAILLTWTMVASAYEDWYVSFEKNFYETVQEMKSEFEDLAYCGGLAFEHESTAIFRRELKYVLYGYAAVFLFMVLQMRYDGHLFTGVCVSLAGLAAVGLSVVLMTSCCALFGLFWTNVSLIIPPILLGIGIDDMFVVVQSIKLEKAADILKCRAPGSDVFVAVEGDAEPSRTNWRDTRASRHRRQRAVTALLSRTLGKVGLSIFVTSLSDVLAFMVGSTFIMPATSSLCIWLGVGISFVFVLMNTFFVACLALIERYRFPKWRKSVDSVEEEAPAPSSTFFWRSWRQFRSKSSRRQRARSLDGFAQVFKQYYIPITVTKGFAVFSCVSTLGLLIVCVYGATQVELQWDVWKLIPDDSFLHHYKEMAVQYFPQLTRMPVQVVFRDMDFQKELTIIDDIVTTLGSIDLLHSEHDWLSSFQMYLRLSTEIEPKHVLSAFPTDESNSFPSTRDSFYFWLRAFLDSGVMRSARKNLFFDENVTEIAANGTEYAFSYNPLKACQFTFGYDFSARVKENMRFVEGLNETIRAAGVAKSNAFLFSHLFISIEQERFLPSDLTRNLCLSMLLIGGVVCIFFANVRMSLLCVLTVFLSLIDVFGLIYYYDLTLEPVTAMTMTILIGLGIDFSIHVGHAFIFAETACSSRSARVRAALSTTGPAIIHGGLSTAIAMAPLVPSAAYAFQAFSKLIMSMVAVGLWHGLVFLPSLLLAFGPAAPIATGDGVKKDEMAKNMPGDGGGGGGGGGGGSDEGSDEEKRYAIHLISSNKKRVTRRKKSCFCACVNAEKEVSTIRTYSSRARTVASPLRRRARLENKRRRHHDARGCHGYLVSPPRYVLQWIVDPALASESDGAGRTKGSFSSNLPRIPRARVRDDGVGCDGSDGLAVATGALEREVVDSRCKLKDRNVFRPIAAAPPSEAAEAAATADELRHPQPLSPAPQKPGFFPPQPLTPSSITFHSLPVDSPLPACPPTPPPPRTKPTEVERDSLFNSSYHPVTDSDDYYETNPSTTITPADSLSSFNTGANSAFTTVTPAESDSASTQADTLVRFEKTCRLRQTSLSISVSMGGFKN